jgi:preprotein translocase subunit SecB
MPTQKKSLSTQTNKDYAIFIQGLDLVGIGLTKCVSHIDRSAFFKLGQKQKTSMKVFTQEYHLRHMTENYFDAEGHFTLAISESQKSKPALIIDFVFLTHIHGQSPVSKQHAERFCNSELRLLLVPYARQFVSSLSSQMSIPPIVLPLTVRGSD